MRDVRASENKQITELVAAQQRELVRLASQNSENLKELKESQEVSEKEHAARIKYNLSQQMEKDFEQKKITAQARAGADTERILQVSL